MGCEGRRAINKLLVVFPPLRDIQKGWGELSVDARLYRERELHPLYIESGFTPPSERLRLGYSLAQGGRI